jgi:steroid delta-isomerase-like uncharacterized protein
MVEDNKRIVRRLIDEVWNGSDFEVQAEIQSPEFESHDSTSWAGGNVAGRDAAIRGIASYRSAFPDLHFAIEDQIGEGEQVVTRWTGTATHEGPLLGMPPTGRKVRVTGVFIHRLEEGRIREAWSEWDILGLMTQLGMIPDRPGPPSRA